MTNCKDETTRAEILTAAQRLFEEFGLRKTTMEDIAREICKGKSSLYYYYCSKEEIFEAVIRKELEELCNKTASAVASAKSAEGKLKAYAYTRLKTLGSMRNLCLLVKTEMIEGADCQHKLGVEFEERDIQLVRGILKFGVDNGEFDSRLSGKMEITPYIIISSLKGFEFDLFTGNRFQNVEKRIDAIIELMVQGLGSVSNRFSNTFSHMQLLVKS